MSKKFSNILVLFIAISLCFFYYWRGQKHKEIIQNDFQIANGKIIECKVHHRAALWIKYSFTYRDEIYYNSQSLIIDLWKGNLFVNKSFPVIFSKNKPNVNEILIFPKDFERYKMPYPDSLIWVNKLLDKSSE
jgi:hypothetical protein